LLLDDEKTEGINLNKILEHWANENYLDISCDYFSNGKDFLIAVNSILYDIVFMDIYMKEPNGIQTAIQMRQKCPNCCLIFLTSSQEHMLEAFPCHAFDYLLKPLDYKRLIQTLSDFLRIFPEEQHYLNLPFGKQTVPILYSHLEYVFTDRETYRCRIPFHKLKTLLEEDERFCIINRGIIVNLDYVETMEDFVCWMKNGTSFPINTRKNAELKQLLITYRFNIRRKLLLRR